MNPTLTKEAHKELMEILQKQFSGFSAGYPAELVEDLGLTFLNLTVIALKRRLKINKKKDTL
jgi:hypothetical protein